MIQLRIILQINDREKIKAHIFPIPIQRKGTRIAISFLQKQMLQEKILSTKTLRARTAAAPRPLARYQCPSPPARQNDMKIDPSEHGLI